MAKLYVGNLPFEVNDEKLQEFFNGQGIEVQSARVISQLNGVPLDGRPLQVNEARPQAARGEGGGYGRGGGGRGGYGGGRGMERDRDRDRDRGGYGGRRR